MKNTDRIEHYLKGNHMGTLTPKQVRRLRKKGRKQLKKEQGHYHQGRKYPDA